MRFVVWAPSIKNPGNAYVYYQGKISKSEFKRILIIQTFDLDHVQIYYLSLK